VFADTDETKQFNREVFMINVNVYDCSPSEYGYRDYDGNAPAIVGRVKYNDRLDYWDGHNMGNGGTGMHLGITRLSKSGKMVLIVGTQWEGCKDKAYIVSDAEALKAVLESGNENIVDEYPQLKAAQAQLDGE
jgi:hypothetical protein